MWSYVVHDVHDIVLVTCSIVYLYVVLTRVHMILFIAKSLLCVFVCVNAYRYVHDRVRIIIIIINNIYSR